MTFVWAHRGASKAAPENTLAAFAAAVTQRADGVELDVQMSADGEVVVCHDETLDRTTNGQGPLKNYTLAELRRLDAGRGERIPTLEQVLTLLKPSRLEVNIELKNSVEPYPGLQQATIDVVRAAGMADRVWYSSFGHDTLPQILEIEPTARVGLLVERMSAREVAHLAVEMGAEAVHPEGRLLRIPGYGRVLKRAGLRIHPWTVDAPRLLRRCKVVGADAIITNTPAESRAILED